ncbi:hypothetical protein BS50DRAFT_209847 [Corynespora cassiicola Philippines]|uniref:Uncharacterized protein n=1 Tax=Corynespora cassiicola Philippines TaxID=1448308 RepID=A0A2T2N4V9_CORCC|nr:hypothetical protein BS50DRAFT_209847 [Corynespora cassiicola Philippines]
MAFISFVFVGYAEARSIVGRGAPYLGVCIATHQAAFTFGNLHRRRPVGGKPFDVLEGPSSHCRFVESSELNGNARWATGFLPVETLFVDSICGLYLCLWAASQLPGRHPFCHTVLPPLFYPPSNSTNILSLRLSDVRG